MTEEHVENNIEERETWSMTSLNPDHTGRSYSKNFYWNNAGFFVGTGYFDSTDLTDGPIGQG